MVEEHLCPHCGEPIRLTARKCKHCREVGWMPKDVYERVPKNEKEKGGHVE